MMKISELINELQKIKSENGDIVVVKYEYAGGFDINQDTFVWTCKPIVFNHKNTNYVEMQYEDILFSIPEDYMDENDLKYHIDIFMENTIFGKKDTLQFIERYFDCKNEEEKQRVYDDMINFYSSPDQQRDEEIDTLIETVDTAIRLDISFKDIKQLF